MGRSHRRRQKLHDHGVVDVDLPGHRHRPRRHGFSLFGDGLAEWLRP